MDRREQRRLELAAGLLRTATSTGDAAIAAWASLPDDFDLDEIWEPDLAGLLGSAGRALGGAGRDDPALPRLAGIARKNWVEHQLEIRNWSPVAAALRAIGLDVWVAGGALLADAEWAFGGARGERAAGDTRLVVRRADAIAAAGVVAQLGMLRRSAAQVRRRAELHGGVAIQFPGDRWGELAWAPSPWWPIAHDPLDGGGPVRFGTLSLPGVAPHVAAVAAALEVEFGTSPWRSLLDLHRMLASGLLVRPDIERCADEIGATSPVVRSLAVVDLLDGDDGSDLAESLAAITSPRPTLRRHLEAAAFRLGAGRMVVAAPRLLADRWRLDRTSQLPAEFGSRVARRLSRRRG